MFNINFTSFKSLLVVLFIFASLVGNAQATRTWVSGVGDDANPCSRTAPCKTISGAISKTAAGGEISLLDPGGFGGVTITKSITINGMGTLGSMLVSGTNGIIVNAGQDDIVSIIGMNITGATYGQPGLNGIIFNTGKHLNIEDCKIAKFNTGINVNLSTNGTITVKNTTILNNQNSNGIILNSTAGSVAASFDHVYLQGSATGLTASNNVKCTISNSIISNNTTGINNGVNCIINTENCMVNNNTNGIMQTDASAVIRLSNTSILDNVSGISTGGTVLSSGNNRIFGNGSSAPVGVIAQQ